MGGVAVAVTEEKEQQEIFSMVGVNGDKFSRDRRCPGVPDLFSISIWL